MRGWENEVRNDAYAGWPTLQQKIVSCQDPASFDKILRIQNDLNSTQQVLRGGINTKTVLSSRVPKYKPEVP